MSPLKWWIGKAAGRKAQLDPLPGLIVAMSVSDENLGGCHPAVTEASFQHATILDMVRFDHHCWLRGLHGSGYAAEVIRDGEGI